MVIRRSENQCMDEHLDYKLSRLTNGKSTCIKPKYWAYLDSKGGLHKITNEGYYFGFQCDMWVSAYWDNKSWCAGKVSDTKKGVIKEIENSLIEGDSIKWTQGWGKTENIEVGC